MKGHIMRQLVKDNRNAKDIIEIIENYAIEQHKDCIEFIHFMELEQMKDTPNTDRAMIYKKISLEAGEQEKTACNILNRIAGLNANQSYYVNWNNEIDIIDFSNNL